MTVNLKPYVYKKKANPALDAEFAGGKDYGWVRPSQDSIFWRSGLHWYVVSLAEVQRIFRRVEPVYGKLCCGGNSFIMEKLVLILKDGTELNHYKKENLEQKQVAALVYIDNYDEALDSISLFVRSVSPFRHIHPALNTTV